MERERLTLSVEEAAALLGISRTLAYELVARGELAFERYECSGRRMANLEYILAGRRDRSLGRHIAP